MQNKFLLFLIPILLAINSPVYADYWLTPAGKMHPLITFNADCLHKAPIRKCCTDYTASSCSEEGCESSAACVTGSFDTCAVRNGDPGLRCCTDGTAASCASPEVYCLTDPDCSGAGANDTCAILHTGGSEVPGPRWECTKTNSPELVFEKLITANVKGTCIGGSDDGDPCSTIADCAGSPDECGIVVACQIGYNTKSVSGTMRFTGRALSISDDASPAEPTFSKVTVDDTVSADPYRRGITGLLSFPLENATTGTWCDFAAGECINKVAKFFIGLNNTGTSAADPARIRYAYCRYR